MAFVQSWSPNDRGPLGPGSPGNSLVVHPRHFRWTCLRTSSTVQWGGAQERREWGGEAGRAKKVPPSARLNQYLFNNGKENHRELSKRFGCAILQPSTSRTPPSRASTQRNNLIAQSHGPAVRAASTDSIEVDTSDRSSDQDLTAYFRDGPLDDL
jgi:hypothetical protein